MLDGEERVLANLGGNIASVVSVLDSDEVLVCGTNLFASTIRFCSQRLGGTTKIKATHLLVLVANQNLVNPLLSKKVVLQIVRVLIAPRCRSRVHPFQLVRSFLACLLLL